jgi:hypothetical protein
MMFPTAFAKLLRSLLVLCVFTACSRYPASGPFRLLVEVVGPQSGPKAVVGRPEGEAPIGSESRPAALQVEVLGPPIGSESRRRAAEVRPANE